MRQCAKNTLLRNIWLRQNFVFLAQQRDSGQLCYIKRMPDWLSPPHSRSSTVFFVLELTATATLPALCWRSQHIPQDSTERANARSSNGYFYDQCSMSRNPRPVTGSLPQPS
eukprot:g70910.t1